MRFGNVGTVRFSVVSDSEIDVTAPAHAVGAVHVQVVTRVGTTPASRLDLYSFTRSG